MAVDLDGLTILAGLDAYGRWHHALTHGLAAAVVIVGLCAYWAKDRPRVWWLGLAAFHLHLVCDWLGSGVDWPIQYFWPLSETLYYTPYGWELDAWPNWVVTVVLLLACGRLAITSGRSFAETCLPATADAAVVAALRQRFSQPTRYGVLRGARAGSAIARTSQN